MGKAYRDELDLLAQTTLEAFANPVDRLKRAIEDNAAHGLVIVASGGSQTSALFLAELHQQAFGHPCRVVTPLVFQSNPTYGEGCVWLLSAGGRNPDILGAAAHAISAGAHSITALVAAEQSALQALLSGYGAGRTIAFSLSAGGDGFLATNSLWASCLLLERAYQTAIGTSSTALTLEDLVSTLTWADAAVDAIPELGEDLVGVGDPETMVGLADLEMRATEAALADVWVTDLRNLGHGRHYWFASRGPTTQAVCLVTEAYVPLAKKTLDLLQDVSPVYLVTVPGTGSGARLASIAFSIFAAGRLGAQIHRDPGRPGVPEFGEALYKLTVPSPVSIAAIDMEQDIILAKIGARRGLVTEEELAYWSPHLDAYRAKLEQANISAVVFDFDGTLIESSRRYEPLDPAVVRELQRLAENGISVGIATGRGDSCGDALRAQLPRSLWERFVVGYYNGACIQPLAQIEIDQAPMDPAIEEAERRIKRHLLSRSRGRCRVYPTQCSVSVLDGRSLSELWCHTSALLRDLVEGGKLRIWMSSHSVDVIAGHVTKRTVVSAVASTANCLPEEVLCIGDRGQWPGNDTELLDMPLTLSADQCSGQVDRCWNLAGASRRQVVATCYQLQLFNAFNGVLRFRRESHA